MNVQESEAERWCHNALIIDESRLVGEMVSEVWTWDGQWTSIDNATVIAFIFSENVPAFLADFRK